MTIWVAMHCPVCKGDVEVPDYVIQNYPVQTCDYNGCPGVLELVPPYQDPAIEEGCRYERAFGDGSDIG